MLKFKIIGLCTTEKLVNTNGNNLQTTLPTVLNIVGNIHP
jgi:hypothetical protein